MCGIAGIYAYHHAANAVNRLELARISEHMKARGPDGEAKWFDVDGRIGLAHRRLSIIDLSDTGAQPMSTVDGKLTITFNGEIYNYRELRRQAEAQGRIFRTQSDTEVLLHLYALKGAAMLGDLRGMFAFGIWDAEQQQLFLARDPYGIKPLYYADDGWTCRFGSQVKSLLAGGAISNDADPAGWAGYYLFGSVPEPYTTLRQIRAVPAGSYVMVDRNGIQAPMVYHRIASVYGQPNALTVSMEESQELIRAAVLDSVRHHLVADVPVGAFLSAGINSGALVGLMRDAGQKDIQTVTVTFEGTEGSAHDESSLAEVVARHYGTRHVRRSVTEAEFNADLPRILAAMDQPTIDGVNTWFVSKAAHELGLKVAISGLGGDELFGGYSSFTDIASWVKWLALPSHIPLLGSTLRRAICGLGLDVMTQSPKAAGMLEFGGTFAGAYLLKRGLFMPWELPQVMPGEMAHEGLRRLGPLAFIDAQLNPRPRGAFAKIATLEAAHYMRNQLLRDTDWASMAHSLEVRVPLVDATLLKRVGPLAAGSKQARKRALAISPASPLPRAIVERQKTGFTTPTARWLQNGAVHHRKYSAVPQLQKQNCSASRRWAYVVASA